MTTTRPRQRSAYARHVNPPLAAAHRAALAGAHRAAPVRRRLRRADLQTLGAALAALGVVILLVAVSVL